tara:strand:- start:841 stop:1008 length:168 start_codon:yes stop_codon:yes gene_type:complete
VIGDLLSTSGRRGAKTWVTSEDAKSLRESLNLISGGIKAEFELAKIGKARVITYK